MSINDHPTDSPALAAPDDVAEKLRALREQRSGTARSTPEGDRTGPTAALALAVGSLVAPLVMWAVINAVHTVSSGAVGGLFLLLLLSCGAALVAFVMGIIGRHDGRGALAIAVSILGGLVSLGSLGAIGLAMAFAGMNAAL